MLSPTQHNQAPSHQTCLGKSQTDLQVTKELTAGIGSTRGTTESSGSSQEPLKPPNFKVFPDHKLFIRVKTEFKGTYKSNKKLISKPISS